MKPCVKNKKLIAWLALDALDIRQAQTLHEHLATCEGCRRYLAEISNVAAKLAVAEANPDVQTTESFHRKVAGKLRETKPDSIGEIVAAYLAGLNWHVALPAVAVLAVIGVTVATWRLSPEVALSPQPGTQTALVSSTETDLAPTIANYQRVANQSLAGLDALLTQQGNRTLPAMPIYTASTRTLANGSF